jgi:Brp/Blh family beta-carotene 15,15'-monooxygenase
MGLTDWGVAGAVVFLSSLLLFGMPHGAVDHYVFFRLRGQELTMLRVLVFCLFYLGLGGVMFLVWQASPVLGVWGFVLLTWWHWGEGDVIYHASRGGRPALFFALWRGALPMVLPVLLHPEAYVRVLEAALRASGSDNFDAVRWVSGESARLALACLVAVLGAVNWCVLLQQFWACSSLKRLALEDVALVLFLLLSEPLLGVGCYFMFWHSLRHIIVSTPLLAYRERRSTHTNWMFFYSRAWPLTVGGILLLVLYHFWARQNMTDVFAWIGSYFVILWSLTWPHAVICHLFKKDLLRRAV